MSYNVGFAQKTITPKDNMNMDGYTPIRKSEGVHDSLYTKVMGINMDGGWYFLISLDLLAIDKYFYQRLKNTLLENGINLIDITVNATHTHSAPEGTTRTDKGVLKGTKNVLGQWNEDYVAYCISQIFKAIEKTMKNTKETVMKIGNSIIQNVGKNRNIKNGPNDKSLLAIEFIQSNGFKALLYLYSCHPTVLNQFNQLLSKDFQYGVECELPEYDFIQYLNGNCGILVLDLPEKNHRFLK